MALFEALKLHKRFGRQVVLEEVSLGFEAGCLSGIMGPNGAGKTTCFHVLTGHLRPDRGRVVFDGTEITGWTPQRIAGRGVARSFQTMALFDEFSALRNVLTALPGVRRRGLRMLDRLAGAEEIDEGMSVLDQVGLAHAAAVEARHLPYGDRRRLDIALALAARPKLLFLDEPTSGLGTEAVVQLAELLRRLKSQFTIVVIEHNMPFLFRLADRISVMHWGQVIAEGTPEELRRDRWVRASNLGHLA